MPKPDATIEAPNDAMRQAEIDSQDAARQALEEMTGKKSEEEAVDDGEDIVIEDDVPEKKVKELEGKSVDEKTVEDEVEVVVETDSPGKNADVKAEDAKPKENDTDKEKKSFDEDVKQYMEKHRVDEKVARADVEGIYNQIKHYNGDVKQIAKALLNSQRGYSKLEQENKSIRDRAVEHQEAKPVSDKDIRSRVERGEWVLPSGRKDSNGNEILRVSSKDEIVSIFCKQNPELTEDLDSEKVFALACKEIAGSVNESRKRSTEAVPEKAKAKRAELMANLKDAINPEYVEELKENISDLSDSDVLNPDFDIKFAATFVKGVHYDEAIAKAEKTGYERGLVAGKENVKIVESNKLPASDGGTRKKTTITLTADQKERAEQMFARNDDMTLQEKYLAYVEIHRVEFKDLKKK